MGMVPMHGDKFEEYTSVQGGNYERTILSAQILVWAVGFAALILTSILILRSLSSMVQRFKSISTFQPSSMEYGGEEEEELESVECFSVDSLDTARRTGKHHPDNSCTQNGFSNSNKQ